MKKLSPIDIKTLGLREIENNMSVILK